MNSSQFIIFSINFIIILGDLILYAILGRVILSWVSMGNPRSRGRIQQLLIDVTDPILNLAKKLPHKVGMLDLSPFIALIGVQLIVKFLTNFLANTLV